MGSQANQRLRKHLDAHDVAYRVLTHEPAASAADYNATLGCRFEQQAKAVLVRTKGAASDFALVVVPGNARADLGAVRAALGSGKVRMAMKDEMERVTGCQFGEVHAMASLFDVPLLLDAHLAQAEPELYMNAGMLTESVVVPSADVVRIEGPVVGKLTQA